MTFKNTLLKYRESNNGDRAMVDGINFNGKVDIIGKTQAPQGSKADDIKLGGFGYGFQNAGGNGLTVERQIPGLSSLEAQFSNVEFAKYQKNTPQLTISDADYIPDQTFEEKTLCEV